MNLVSKFLFLLAFLMLAACASGPRPGSAPTVNPEAQAVEAYRIGVDDVVRVAVWQNPDLNVTVPVRPDGRISVPLVGDVVAGGRTPEEVAAEIKTALEKFVRNPQVTVIIDQLRSHEYLARVRVTGAVRTPISVPYRQGMTVLDAVLAAGGTNEFAAADRTELYRKEGDSTRAFAVRLDRILQKGELDTNYPVQPGDVITVPERTF
ncbi:MAG: polysaccharide biosynthesis/export family protein [Dokdonella sp.]|mgnify:FL=1|jgi:polysaccharide biosynthesis/export protein|uniref:XrtA/PEP-CTERM system exopolysaccharide export protein n=1 Tax=Dokdonella sp. TaxID=2291710 RepID=UPI001B642ABA|nr:XrtA/PEP-CTERM system exopolysaccharide export protein [Dokdonella sp.]MCC6441402.1 polysaccharide biosynthesis/export family protein [Rhodanobacteraceae bacterium]MBK8124147.1 polysaccharide biosynthesis/export family protein [Dokdonella sp.]MBP6326402.1 polysaccharide biosynthesis/export family protein [Dokdonella sp.]MBP6329204.1 polysaccharide biosynthesis/export family protein [Dokdonella sp.]HNV08228.1 polysaccharide biosynthesis/export family protein [Dokdonella sp.]